MPRLIGSCLQRSLLLLSAFALWAPAAHAVPSFARQTGMACEACHTVFPELTHFGRMFKANGYTLDNLKQVRDIDTRREEELSLSSLPPISAMIQVSETWLNEPLPDGTGGTGAFADRHGWLPAAAQPFLCWQGRATCWGHDSTHLR